MNRRRSSARRRFLVAFAVIGLVAPACGSGSETVVSPPRLLDEVCAVGAGGGASTCPTTGDAVTTTGLTEDTTGFSLGAHGALTIPTADIDLSAQLWILARTTTGEPAMLSIFASCDGVCPPVTSKVSVSADYGWVLVPPSFAEEASKTLTFSGPHIEILDVRTVKVIPVFEEGGCLLSV